MGLYDESALRAAGDNSIMYHAFSKYISNNPNNVKVMDYQLNVNSPYFKGTISIKKGLVNGLDLFTEKFIFNELRNHAVEYLKTIPKDYTWSTSWFGIFKTIRHRFGPYASFVHVPFTGYQIQFSDGKA